MNQSSHTFCRRNLPHWHPVGRSFFLTRRLYGSLPQFVINRLGKVRQRLRIQPNHVHVFLKPKRGNSLEEITKQIKGYTAREANRLLGRTGKNFWQDESFDHWSRDEDEFFRIVDYIKRNL